ncbi:TetR family transcriptional regulator [Mycolicibacterium neoaurum]|uniref:acyl-CoA-like ligand-binding transcription factor n=1 Tax=Mycolicibacterium neoaurum TaxID=1795 RepID=UPI00267194CB|nr:TetR family transcriptional regulator [Mycolicibacterium neoaurum]MDO3403012.1 TetR family transcriptional regulator [Mycolicibacterium neoaurum]
MKKGAQVVGTDAASRARHEGLRERKKREMRARLSAIALDLAVEHGVAGVRIDQIASAAGVSPRTFNNYFPSKEAAIVGVAAIRADVFRATLHARPADEPLAEALRAAAAALFTDEPDRTWMARSRLIRSEPSLFAEERKSDIEVERVIAAEIGDRTGTDPHVDLAPRLAAATVIAAIHAAVQYWLDVPAAGTLREVVERAIVDSPLGGARS